MKTCLGEGLRKNFLWTRQRTKARTLMAVGRGVQNNSAANHAFPRISVVIVRFDLLHCSLVAVLVVVRVHTSKLPLPLQTLKTEW